MSPPERATIFALSSGALPAGIAVVRVSGSRARSALESLAGRVPAPRRASLALLRSPAGVELDRALLLWLPGPKTATGEDMAELHLHGGRATVRAVLDALSDMPGLMPAEAGEFTRRALENGRMDLTEVEGLADLLEAETEHQRRAALLQAEGGLSRLLAGWRTRLLGIGARIEAAIDFAEDHGDQAAFDPDPARGEMAALADDIGRALAQPPAERLRDGLRVVIAGPANAGKSSLLNALAGREAAIILPEEGTTRDLIEVPLSLGGMPLLLVDSAGLRETDSMAEREGIARARRAAEDADILLWLGEPSQCPPVADRIVVHPRADLPGREVMPAGADLAISVSSGANLDLLREMILARADRQLPRDDQVALNQRHRAILQLVLRRLEQARAETDDVLVAELLRQARSGLDRVTGGAGVEEMLDSLYTRFCIGK